MNDLELLNQSLDSLIGIIELSTKEVYDEIKFNERYNYANNPHSFYSNDFERYQDTLCISAFILGFTYFEDFISKCTVKLLSKLPDLNKSKVTIKEFNQMGSNYVTELALKEAYRLPISNKLKLMEKQFLALDSNLKKDIDLLRVIRNCIIHNNGIINDELSRLDRSNYALNTKMILTPNIVNSFGKKARQYSAILWQEINKI